MTMIQIDAAVEALKPDGLDDDEWALVREHRAKKAAEEARDEMWRQVLAELVEAAGDNDDWRAAGERFISRAGSIAGWDDVAGDNPETDSFIEGLLMAADWREEHIRNHGTVWQRG